MDFTSTVKYLDIVKARKTTSAEDDGAKPALSKYHSITKARHIHKLQQQIVLQAHTQLSGNVNYENRLLFQYNVTMPTPFVITSPALFDTDTLGYLTIKWRVGTDVFRYFLRGNNALQLAAGETLYAPEAYGNQVIPRNCVFEYWFLGSINIQVGLLTDLYLGASRLVNPSDVNQTTSILLTATPIDIATFGVALPEALPYNQPDQAWLTN